ncbi:MAG: DNA translocase FtsK [Oscillospiraceae bacterium]
MAGKASGTKKKPAAKKASGKKPAVKKPSPGAQRRDDTYNEDRRFWSVVLLLAGIFAGFVTYLRGSGLWEALHDIERGLFGKAVYAFAPLLILLAVLLSADKPRRWFRAKAFELWMLLFVLCGIFTAANGEVAGANFLKKLGGLFSDGVISVGGGLAGAPLGWMLMTLCGRTGALVVLCLLTAGFVLLQTNLTALDVFRLLTKPFRSGYRAVREEHAEKSARAAQEKAGEKPADEFVDYAKYLPKDKNIFADDPAPASEPPLVIPDEPKKKKRRKQSYFDTFSGEGEIPADDGNATGTAVFSADGGESTDDETPPWDTAGEAEPETPEERKAVLDRIVRKAVGASDPAADAKPAEPVKHGASVLKKTVYMEKDGQTTLFEKTESASIYLAPPVSLLKYPANNADPAASQGEIRQKSETLIDTLKSFGVQTRIVDIHRGPSVTRYEVQPAAGVKVSKITGLSDDIALNLAAEGVRIEAPIPGKAAVGIELANKYRDSVSIRELIDSEEFRAAKGKLCFAVGKNIEGKIVVGDISKMPHLLIAGTTGSGKSVFTNSIIMNILYKASPAEVKLILIDPKQVEFPIYNGIPHLLVPVVTEARKAAGALGWAVNEMLRRYKQFSDNGVRDIADYNDFVRQHEELEPMPQIVIVVDELADLMMAAPKEVEDSICRIAQLARAAGMHLIIATQSPRVDIVTGLIKANIPSRVALKVSNQTDSRVILDEGGAEKLLGQGDLLYKPVGLGKPLRVQGSFVPTREVREVVEFLKNQEKASYDEQVLDEIEKNIPVPKGEKPGAGEEFGGEGADEMLEDAITVIVESGRASTSYLQSRLKLGYARAARIMDDLEKMGIVGETQGAKPRKILISKEQWAQRQAMR